MDGVLLINEKHDRSRFVPAEEIPSILYFQTVLAHHNTYQEYYAIRGYDEIEPFDPSDIEIPVDQLDVIIHRGYGYQRCASGALEKLFADLWEEENLRRSSTGGLLQILLSHYGLQLTQDRAQMAAMIIQWLGTNVGRCFLRKLALYEEIDGEAYKVEKRATLTEDEERVIAYRYYVARNMYDFYYPDRSLEEALMSSDAQVRKQAQKKNDENKRWERSKFWPKH